MVAIDFTLGGISEAPQDGIQYTRGNSAWTQSSDGEIISANRTLDGTETPADFSLVATATRTLTLPLASTVAAGYLLDLTNQSNKKDTKWTIATQGGDTINGGTSFDITTGESFLIERISSTAYTRSNAAIDVPALTEITGAPGDSKILIGSDDSGVAQTITKDNFLKDVPTVAIEEFANTDARFFGELGLAAGQQTWVDIATGSATIDLVTENVFGESKQVIRHNDNVADGSTTSQISLTAQDWIDINTFGAPFGGTARLDSFNGGNGFFSGLQADAAENPLVTGDRRYGILFDDQSGKLRLIEADKTSNNVAMDGTGGNPLVAFDEYFTWECLIPAGLGAARVFINGILTTFVPTFFVNGGGLGTRALMGSGSTGQTDRVSFHENFGVTIYEESATKTLAVTTMQADVARIFVPGGKRDYTLVLPDGNPRNLGDVLAFMAQNVGGIITLKTQNVSVPQSLFVGENELDISITGVDSITLINTVDNANIYEFSDPPVQPDELSPLYVSTANATVANTTVATTVVGTGEGSLTVPLDSVAVGDCFQFRAGGIFSAGANPTLRLKLFFGSVFIGDTLAVVISNATNSHWVLEGTATVRSIGPTGTISVEGGFTTSENDHFGFTFLVPTIVDTTINNNIDITAQWGTASAGNTITGQNVSIIKVLSS